jgi:hypothetical protein
MANNTVVTITAVYDITSVDAKVDVTISNIIPVGDQITTNAGDWATLQMNVTFSFNPPPFVAGQARSGAFFVLRDHTLFPSNRPAPGYGGGTSYSLTGVTLNRPAGSDWDGTIHVRARTTLALFTGNGTSVNLFDSNSSTETFSFSDEPLSATFVKTDVTVNGGSDGTITVTPAGGSGSYSFAWADSVVTTPTRTGLSANNYDVTVTDTVSLATVTLTIQIFEPGQVIVDVPAFFEVPKMQSLQFVVSETIDGCSVFQTPDNRLLCQQEHAFFAGLSYEQLYQQCDSFPVQFRSSFSNVTARLLREVDDTEIATYTITKIVEGLNNDQTFDVRLQSNGGSQTRVYFIGFSAPPVIVNTGDTFALFNTPQAIDGEYEIVNILLDAANNQQYLVINVLYGSVSSSETAEAQFNTDLLPFDIYEFPVSFAGVLPDLYRIEITAVNASETETLTATSEPIRVAVQHPNAMVITWANVDNAFDIDYSNNAVHRIRVDGWFFQRLPNADRDGFREISGDYQLLFAKPRRRIRAEFLDVPAYMHEKLAVIFLNDTVRINGVLVASEGGLEEPVYRTRYGLSNSTVVVEVLDWFNNYNTDDPGGIDLPQTAFVLRDTDAFIKR